MVFSMWNYVVKTCSDWLILLIGCYMLYYNNLRGAKQTIKEPKTFWLKDFKTQNSSFLRNIINVGYHSKVEKIAEG